MNDKVIILYEQCTIFQRFDIGQERLDIERLSDKTMFEQRSSTIRMLYIISTSSTYTKTEDYRKLASSATKGAELT